MDDAAFPIELFQLIIDQVAVEEYNQFPVTMRACSLVCKAFVPLCQRHLFHDIYLGIHNNTSISRSCLIRLLEGTPIISSYIKDVVYSLFTDEDQKDFLGDNSGDIDSPSRSVYEGGYSASLHELLPGIRSLGFYWHKHSDPEWSTNTGPCCEVQIDCIELFHVFFQGFAGSPTITSLEVDFMGIGLQDILVFPSLQIFKSSSTSWTLSNALITQLPLHLKSLDLSSHDSFPIRILEYCPDIEHLQIEASAIASSSLQEVSSIIPEGLKKVATYTKLQTAHVRNLSDLTCLCNTAEMVDVVAFPSLDQLTLRFQAWYLQVDETAALHKIMRHAPNIRSLTLTNLNLSSAPELFPMQKSDQCLQGFGTTLEHISLSYCRADPLGRRREPGSIPVLCNALSSIKSNNQLKTIYLHLNILEGRVDSWMKKLRREWGELDSIITANSGRDFLHLKKITFCVGVEGSQDYDTHTHLPKFRATLQSGWAQKLPLLHETFEAVISYPEPLSWIHELVLVRRELVI